MDKNKAKQSFDDKFKVLQDYANAHEGVITGVKVDEKFVSDGKEYCVGTMVRNIRRMYKNQQLSCEEIEKLKTLGVNFPKPEDKFVL